MGVQGPDKSKIGPCQGAWGTKAPIKVTGGLTLISKIQGLP